MKLQMVQMVPKVVSKMHPYKILTSWCHIQWNLKTTHLITLQARWCQKCFQKKFIGTYSDMGVDYGSSACLKQYETYWKFVGQPKIIDMSKAIICHFGVGDTMSFRLPLILFPIGQFSIFVFDHVENENTSMPLSIDVTKHLRIYLCILEDCFVHPKTETQSLVFLFRGHIFAIGNANTSCFLANIKIKRLKRRFAHPLTKTVMELWNFSGLSEIGIRTRKLRRNFKHRCQLHQTYAQILRLLCSTLRNANYFNNNIYAGIYYME